MKTGSCKRELPANSPSQTPERHALEAQTVCGRGAHLQYDNAHCALCGPSTQLFSQFPLSSSEDNKRPQAMTDPARCSSIVCGFSPEAIDRSERRKQRPRISFSLPVVASCCFSLPVSICRRHLMAARQMDTKWTPNRHQIDTK